MRRALVWLGLAVSLVFAYLAVRDTKPAEVVDALAAVNWAYIPAGFAVFALSIWLKAVRWRALFSKPGRPPIGPVTEALLVGYLFNTLLPARAGEAARVVALNRRARASRAETTGTVVIERLYDVLSLLVLLFAALPLLPRVTWLDAAMTLAGVLTVGLIAATVVLAVYGDRPVRSALSPLSRLPGLSRERIDLAATRLAAGFAGLRQPRLALAAFGWSIVSWLVMALSFWLLMLAFDPTLPPVAGLFVLVAIGLAMILPSSPAAVGVFEAAAIAALIPFGLSRPVALSFALVAHAVQVLFYVAAGGAVLIMRLTPARAVAGRPR